MDINHQAPLVAREELFIQAPPAVVWETLADIGSWDQWQPGVDEIKLEGPVAPGSSFRLKGGSMTWHATIQEVEPERRLGWTGGTVGTQAIHLWELRPQDGGTLLITEESLQGWLAHVFRIVKPKFLEETLDTSLQAVGEAVEKGH
jgi:uncharacterized protein YndB with AHSA1/START domain